MIRIISGGQAGGDLGGNLFALKYSIPTAVQINKGFRPARGRVFPKELPVLVVSDKMGIDGLRERTRYNVIHSDATLIFTSNGVLHTPGSLLTDTVCELYHKPRMVISVKEPPDIRGFLTKISPHVINVSGQRDLEEDEVIAILERNLL